MKININSALAALNSTKVSADDRENLIMKGSVLVLEAAARAHNDALTKAGRAAVDYGSQFATTAEYNKQKAQVADDILYFCAKKCNDFAGLPTDRADRSTFTDVRFAADAMYLGLLSGIISQIQYTVTPPLVNELVGEMASTITVPKGKTAEIEITSNAVSSGRMLPGLLSDPCRETSSTTAASPSTPVRLLPALRSTTTR